MRVLVNIDVPDLQQGVAFYEAALPLRTTRLLFDRTVAELQGAGAPIYLLEKVAGTPATAQGSLRCYKRHWTPVHLDFEVPDIDAAVARATDAGAVLEAPIDSYRWGRLARFTDPFGNGFCLVQWNGQPYDGEEAVDLT